MGMILAVALRAALLSKARPIQRSRPLGVLGVLGVLAAPAGQARDRTPLQAASPQPAIISRPPMGVTTPVRRAAPKASA